MTNPAAESFNAIPAPTLPRRFGRYTLFDAIGKGGMAEIFLARTETELGAVRLVVVKQILSGYASDPEFSDMLIHEAKLAARLTHANIVQVLDLGREADRLFIAMEYVEGFDLNALLRLCTKLAVPLPSEFAFSIVLQVLRALDYAHRRTTDATSEVPSRPLGIVHRDVSPSNVLVSFEGEIKLCDFGIAHANDTVKPESREIDEAIRGKAGYMSPEQARGDDVDARADVFAVGILLWELVAGRRMYKTEPEGPTLLEKARAAAIPELPSRGLPLEDRLRSLIARALSPSRDDRYASAGAMLRDLEAYVTDAKLVGSQLRLGDWLYTQFGTDIVRQRRERERAARALDGKSRITGPPGASAAPDVPSVKPVGPEERALVRQLTSPNFPPPPRMPSMHELPPLVEQATADIAGLGAATKSRRTKTHVGIGIAAVAIVLLLVYLVRLA
ncbi:MAG: serine/threonine-protein kinase [Polyangiaceae bacterium]